jgi:hypothetical protein
MLWLTEDARIACDHGGGVENKWSQDWVRIAGRRVLVATDPEGRDIDGCPNANVAMGMRPCNKTLRVRDGYSSFVTIGHKAVVLDTLGGLTDGSPPGLVRYKMLSPGQKLVGATA